MMAAFTWIITFISLAGTVLSVRKNILCFYLWAIGNVAWLGFDVASGLFSRAVLDAVHLAFAIWGDIRVEREGKPSLVTEKSVIGTYAPMTRIHSTIPESGLFPFRAR